ncbi:uncharacterized protein Pyn_29032 [Prunus yedoensis var. nudiflora]|uniref:Glutaredoxin domain-containing protein n=1 Tax=Prunus yedoensis var. nudiflora TaxID=2094558 RepID=A0A314UGX4_PRUYE|nr:uncharacterized protein Pyn_29032 [Prunus yedoensis var. nudiflora]
MWRPWGKSTVQIHNTSSPSSPFSFSSFKDIQTLCADDNEHSQQPTNAAARRTSAIFHRVRVANSLLRAWSTRPPTQPQDENSGKQSEPSISSIPGAEKRIVVYFTSLRVVRPTFEDCRTVRSILRGFRVSLDERDLAMDHGFLTELQQILGQHTKLTLPRVFIGGRYIGGADEVRTLHEAGELKKFVEGLPAQEPGVCDTCGGYRFILCVECSGSHKLYTEKNGFKSCTSCNENGLIRCPSCSCAPL